MKPLYYSLLFGAVLALMQLALIALVVKRRISAKVELLDGGDVQLIRRIRAHGNFTENLPIHLLLLGFLEVSGFSSIGVVLFGALFLVGRMLHAWALIAKAPLWMRTVGMSMTMAVISFQAAACLWLFATR